MAEVPFVELLPRVTPVERPVVVRARVLGPPAVEHDSHLGGHAGGLRFRYADAMEFVWWTPDAMPTDDGAGFGNGFDSGFEGGVGSPTGSGFAAGFSNGFR